MTAPEPEVAAAVGDLKADIHRAVTDAIMRCYARIGLTPSDILIDMMEITQMQDRLQQYTIRQVRVRFGSL
jgi:hypothetical protein